jgi:hypothetical protein
VLCVLTLALRQVEPVIEAWWFYPDTPSPFGSLANRWVSWLVVTLAGYGAILLAFRIRKNPEAHPAIEFARQLLLFQLVLSWLFTLQYISIESVLGGGEPQPPPNEAQVLLVSSLAALIWPLAAGLPLNRRRAGWIFVTSVVVLGLAAVTLDSWMLDDWALRLGLIQPRKTVMMTRNFLRALPFLASIPPTLWTIGRSAKATPASAESRACQAGHDRRPTPSPSRWRWR